MFCCVNCFSLPEPMAWIRESGATGSCDFCGSVAVSTCDPSELNELFAPVLDYYEVRQYGEHYLDPDSEIAGDSLAACLQHDWSIFNEERLDLHQMEDLLQAVLPAVTVRDAWLTVHDRWYVEPDEHSAQWQQLANHLLHERRFIPDENNPSVADIIGKLPAFIEDAAKTLSKGTVLYRARIGYRRDKHGHIRPYPPSKMGCPPPDATRYGRANPPGISYLYMATNANTAVSEKRPARGMVLSLARLIAQRDLEIINLTDLPIIDSPFVDSLRYRLEARSLLVTLGSELSKPVSIEDSPLGYLPSQYLCETILASGYHGVVYPSRFGDGSNIVLFSQTSMKIVPRVQLVQVGTLGQTVCSVVDPEDLDNEIANNGMQPTALTRGG